MSVRITVVDEQTGDEESKVVADDDYFILCTGDCHVSHVQSFPGSGTHVLTIKGQRAGASGLLGKERE